MPPTVSDMSWKLRAVDLISRQCCEQSLNLKNIYSHQLPCLSNTNDTLGRICRSLMNLFRIFFLALTFKYFGARKLMICQAYTVLPGNG